MWHRTKRCRLGSGFTERTRERVETASGSSGFAAANQNINCCRGPSLGTQARNPCDLSAASHAAEGASACKSPSPFHRVKFYFFAHPSAYCPPSSELIPSRPHRSPSVGSGTNFFCFSSIFHACNAWSVAAPSSFLSTPSTTSGSCLPFN